MDKQPVGQLPDLTQSNNDDEIMVITNDEYNQLKKEKISDFITDLTSTDADNSLVKGDDGKLFVSKTINASDVDGVLSLDNIPQLSTNKLPETGISADNYSYPSSITVNDRGQVVSIVEGSAAEAGAYLDQSQITNCILEAPNGVATYSGTTVTVKAGLKVLIPNGRNADGTLKNVEYTVEEDIVTDYAEVLNSWKGRYFALSNKLLNINNRQVLSILNDRYIIQSTEPSSPNSATVWYNPTTNITKIYNETWQEENIAIIAFNINSNTSAITSLTPYQPVALAKDYDVVHNTGDETINGIKTFNEAIYVDKRNSSATDNRVILRGSSQKLASTPTGFSGCSIQTYASSYDITDETEANLSKAFGPQLLALDKNGVYWGYFEFSNSYFKNSGESVRSIWGVRRYVDGVIKTAIVSLGVSPNSSWFEFPKCNARPTTTSSAGTSNVDVIVKNYYSSTKSYVQFGSGLKIQWGRLAWNQATTYTVTFPLSFVSGTSYVIFKNYGHSVAREAQDREVSFYNKTATSAQTFGESSSTTIYADWLAIGY